MEFSVGVAWVGGRPAVGRFTNALGSRDTAERGARRWEPELADSQTPEAQANNWVRILGRGDFRAVLGKSPPH